MNVHTDPLVDDYLRRLDAAASALPAHQRDELVSQIRDHLEEALRRTPPGDKAAVRNILERLGPPEEIAAAADPPPEEIVVVCRDRGRARAGLRVPGAQGDREVSRQADGLGPGYRGHHPRLDRGHHPGGWRHPNFVPPQQTSLMPWHPAAWPSPAERKDRTRCGPPARQVAGATRQCTRRGTTRTNGVWQC